MKLRHIATTLLLCASVFAVEARADLSSSANATAPPATLAVTALSAANASVTATLPAVAGQFHYISSIHITRTCTAALTGTAALAITTTNLPGSLAWTAGNACAVGSTNNDVAHDFTAPLKSSVVNTATTIVCPAAGAAVVCRITVLYFAAP
jgi:hypothetical protein